MISPTASYPCLVSPWLSALHSENASPPFGVPACPLSPCSPPPPLTIAHTFFTPALHHHPSSPHHLPRFFLLAILLRLASFIFLRHRRPSPRLSSTPCTPEKGRCVFLVVCMSSLHKGHADLLCAVPILLGDTRRESELVDDHACCELSLTAIPS